MVEKVFQIIIDTPTIIPKLIWGSFSTMATKIREITIYNDDGDQMTIKWSPKGVTFEIASADGITNNDPGEVKDAISEVED